MGAQILKVNYNVDDNYIVGCDSIHELYDSVADLTQILKCGGMKLGKYSSNSSEILEKVSTEFQENKTLNFVWQPDWDIFR